jgi:glycerate 2-kinase
MIKELLVKNLISTILKAIDPYEKTLQHLKKIEKPSGKLFLIAFGKSSVKMAKAALDLFKIEKGVVVTNEEVKNLTAPNIEYIQGGHPLPNENSVKAAEKAIEILKMAGKKDLVIVMISGGGSALFESPKVSLDELKSISDSLMKAGATINELNLVRKSLSKVKGGKLPSYTSAKMLSFVMSDVVGDDLSVIASGPTYFEKINPLEVLSVLRRHNVNVSNSLKAAIMNDEQSDKREVTHVLIASNRDACLAAKSFFNSHGYNAVYIGSSIQGEAREIAKVLGGMYTDAYRRKSDFTPPVVFVSGGESTVTVKGNGMGGRNQEMALAMVPIIAGKKITFLSFGTDGIDGYSPAAGAIVDGDTFKRAKELNLDYEDFLKRNDSYTFFKNLSDLIVTGPTGTNVTDVQVAIVG